MSEYDERRSRQAEREFRERIAQFGGVVLEPVWLGSKMPHRVQCAARHECSPRPSSIQHGQGICRVCAGYDPMTAEREFRERIAQFGGVVLEPVWLGSKMPHRVQCAARHECSPRPNDIAQGHGPCRICACTDPATAERAFRERVTRLGGTILEPTWLGSGKSHRVRCAAGHDCSPRPSEIQQGGGLCRACVGQDSAAAHRAFSEAVIRLGGIVIEPAWLGSHAPHRAICAAGHSVQPRPVNVSAGQGICRICAGHVWDIFYVVTNPSASRVKFGITSGNPKPRLQAHARRGYRQVVRLIQYPNARQIEQYAMSELDSQCFYPIEGREYYNISALGAIFKIVDSYMERASYAN